MAGSDIKQAPVLSSEFAGLVQVLGTLVALLRPSLSVEDVALLLNCSVDTVHRIPDKNLPVRIGAGRGNMYRRADVDKYIEDRPLKRSIPQANIRTAVPVDVQQRDRGVVPLHGREVARIRERLKRPA